MGAPLAHECHDVFVREERVLGRVGVRARVKARARARVRLGLGLGLGLG